MWIGDGDVAVIIIASKQNDPYSNLTNGRYHATKYYRFSFFFSLFSFIETLNRNSIHEFCPFLCFSFLFLKKLCFIHFFFSFIVISSVLYIYSKDITLDLKRKAFE